MKRTYLLIAALLIACSSFAENLKPIAQKINERKTLNQVFTNVQLFTVTPESMRKAQELNEKVKYATVMEFRRDEAQRILREQPENIHFIIPNSSGGTTELDLFKATITGTGFSVVTNASNGLPVPYEGGLHYWGIISGDNNSLAEISIYEDEIMGMVSTALDGNQVLGKLEHDSQGLHIFYNEHNLDALPTTQCNTADDLTGHSGGSMDRTTSAAAASAKCVNLYWEVNFDLYSNKGSLTAATNYVTGIFSQSSILYANDGISVTLSQVYVWTSASPYTSTSTSGLLTDFGAFRTSFNGDLGALIGLAGGGGIAWIDGLCASSTQFRECYAGVGTGYNSVPTYSWTVEVITHEQGHLMGSSHTHACVWNGNNTAIDGCGPAAGYGYEGSCSGAPVPSNGGTIMSYCHLISVGINFSLGFGPQPTALILNNISTSTCLSACGGGSTCNAPTGMNTASITASTATFTWTAVSGASSYAIQYRKTGTTTWTSGTSASTSFNVSGLTAGTGYEWQVHTVCSSGSSANTASTTFTTSPAACNAPTGLTTSSITTNSATLSWTAIAGVLSYNVHYRATGTTTWTTVNTTATTYSVSSLTSATGYEWQVQTVCSGGSSAYTASSTFTTLAPPCNAPSGLSTTSITSTSATLNWTGVSGAVSYTVSYRLVGVTTWTTVSTTTALYNVSALTSGSNYEWQVQTVCSSGSSTFSSSTFSTTTSTPCNAPAGLNTNSITTSTATLAWTAVSGAVNYNVRYRLVGTSSWTTASTSVASYIATSLTASTAYEWQIQTVCAGGSSVFTSSTNFTTLAPPCTAPAGMGTGNTTSTTTTLSWSAVSGALSYTVHYRLTGTTTWTSLSTTSTSANLTGLTAGSGYEWQVQTVCSSGSSAFTSSALFTMLALTCDVPSETATSSITTTSATFTWTAVTGAISYNLRYRVTGTTTWTTVSVTGTSYNAGSMSSGTPYEWQVQTVCVFGTSSFASTVNFTTVAVPACNLPTTMMTNSITTTTAIFTWAAVSGANNYNVRYRLVGTTSWINASTAATFYNASNLTAGANYEWQIQTACSAGSSAYTTSTTFTTTSSIACNVPAGMGTSNVTSSGATVSWTAVPGAVSYSVHYRITGTTTWTTVSTTTPTVTLSTLTSGSTYEWQVQTVCSAGSSAFTASTVFNTGTTVTGCNIPTGMATSNITTSSATFTWTAVSGATSYNLRFRTIGSSLWTNANTAAGSYTPTSLIPATSYEWQIQTACPSGSSAFTSSLNFTTLSGGSCDVPSGLAGNVNVTAATLSWTAVSGATGYTLQWRATGASAWTTVTGITTASYNLTGLASCTAYQFQVRTQCSIGTSAYSTPASFTTTGCALTYCTSKANSTTYEYISKVALGSINNASGNNNGYADFTGLSTNVSGGTAYTIALTPGFRGSAYMEYWTVWIDYNHNGSFSDAGEKAAVGNGTALVNAAFTVPASALNGPTRMRIQMQYYAGQANPCATYSYGEVEDYTVVVGGNAQRHIAPTSEPEVISAENFGDVSLFPNPATENISASFTSATRGTAQLAVYNVIGAKVLSRQEDVEEGTNTIKMNTTDLINGIYIFEIEKNGEVRRVKFMVSK